jgi:hypothetical protein
MVFLDWKVFPWYWFGSEYFWVAVLKVLLVPGILAYVFGYFAFRSRIKGVYFSIITQALTYAFMLLFFRNDMGFGGNNGFTDFKDLLGFNLQARSTRVGLLMASAFALAGAYVLCRFIVSSRLGRVLIGVSAASVTLNQRPRTSPRSSVGVARAGPGPSAMTMGSVTVHPLSTSSVTVSGSMTTDPRLLIVTWTSNC